MDIEQLKTQIKAGLNGNLFLLDTATLSSPGITVLASHYLPGRLLKLTNASIGATDSESITVVGEGSELPFKTMSVSARFYILQANAALTLEAKGGAAWTLATAIPAFKNTLGASVKFAQGAGAPTFHFLSDPEGEWFDGLNFEGAIDFKSMNAGISGLLGIETESISGPIKLKNEGAEFVSIDFKGPAITDVNLWLASDCSVALNMESYVLPNPITQRGVPLPNIVLTTTLPFGNNGKAYTLPLSVQIINLETPIRFSADITDVIDASLDALGSLIGGANLGSVIPPDFQIGDYLRFTSLFADFDPDGKSISNIGLEVRTANPWRLFTINGHDFYAQNLFLFFNVITPFGTPTPYLNIGGELTLTDRASLFISASYPNFEILASLKEGSVLSIKEFISQFVGDPAGVPETLTVAQLDLNAKAGDYSFDIFLVGDWQINDSQSLALIVENLYFYGSYTTVEQKASFGGTIRINTVQVSLTADYTAVDSKKGWIFTGQTGAGQRIPIGEFITYLADTFGAGEPPQWMQGITLQDISVSLNTLDKAFDFSVTGNIPIANNSQLKIIVGFSMENVKNDAGISIGYRKVLSGKLFVNKSVFTLVFTSSPSESNILATWEAVNAAGYLQLKDIAGAFGFDEFPDIPEGLDLALKKATLYYDFTTDKQSLLLAAASANYGTVVFVAKKIGTEWTYVFGVNINANISLGNLPLVGSGLESAVGKVGLNTFRLIGATKKIAPADVTIFNTLISEKAGSGYPQLPIVEGGIERGLYCALELALGKDNTYQLQVSTASKPAPTGLPAAGVPPKDDNAYWISLQKAIGPVFFDRAGVGYKDGRISLLLDAALMFTALKIDLIGLGVSNPLKAFDPSFELSGLNIAYQSGPVQIGAGFLKREVNKVTEYNGTALVGINSFSLTALGSYASIDGHPSLFIFALINAPLGGPPAFFVMGVAAGFGYNRGLKLPTIDTVTRFPLVMGFVPNQASPFKGPDPGEALKVLVEDNVVPIQVGQNWLAAGIKFTSFQLLESFALLSFAFGTSLEIGIVGMTTVAVPSKSPVYVAYAQLALLAKLLPDKGVFSVEAKLTPASYLLSKACVLTGGFAFYLWTAPNEYEGDFVVTLGGYHPNFTPPKWYPKVPRLGFNWIVTKEVSLKGGIYFALTPSCVMAGGSLEAVFRSGDLKAWFIIGADFLIAWKPYRYEARLYLSFGVSYTFKLNLLFTTVTKTINVSVGADLSVWGPEFSGIANIHLWIISFKVSFGASGNRTATTISWDEFKNSFLPPSQKTLDHEALYGINAGLPVPTDSYCLGNTAAGLVEDMTKSEDKDPPISWIVSGDGLLLESYSVFPAKEYSIVIKDKNGAVADARISITNPDALAARNKEFGIGMVNVPNGNFRSEHRVILQFEGVLRPETTFQVTAIIRNVAKSMWEQRPVGYTADAVVKNVLVGFRIEPVSPVPDQSVPIRLEYFQYRQREYPHPVVPAQPTLVQGPENVDGMQVMKETINSEPAKRVRKNIIDALRNRGLPVNADVNVEQIAARAQDYIMAPPVLQYTYWKAPATVE